MEDTNKSKDQHGHGSSIPESAQYIDESTLIPPSSFQDVGADGDDGAIIGESTFEIPGEDPVASRSESVAEGKAQSPIKKNLPMIIIGVVGVVLIGGVGMKMMGGGQHAPVQAQVAQNSAAAAPAVAPKPVAPVEKPVVAAAPVNEALAVAPAASASAPVVAKAPELKIPEVVVKAPEAVKAPELVKAPEVVKVPEAAKSAVDGAELNKLKDRVAKLESNQVTACSACSAAAVQPMKKAVVTDAEDRTEVKVKKRTPQQVAAAKEAAEKRHAAALAKKEEREARKAAHAAEEARITTKANSYTVTAVKDNLAWMRSADGEIASYAIGDQLPGVGRLTHVDERARSVTVSGRVIR